MKFERAMELVNATPTGVLCEAWGATPEYVNKCKGASTHMSIREAGALAELHGMKLEDILTV